MTPKQLSRYGSLWRDTKALRQEVSPAATVKPGGSSLAGPSFIPEKRNMPVPQAF